MERTKQEITLVENEQWVQAEVPIDFQRIVEKIIVAASNGLNGFKDDLSDPLSSPLSPTLPRISFQIDDRSRTTNGNNTEKRSTHNSDNNNNSSSSSRYIFVEQRQYFVVGCSLLLIKMIGDYLRCMANIPALTNETMNRIMEILNV